MRLAWLVAPHLGQVIFLDAREVTMAAPSLGFEDDTHLSKSDVATIQLAEAIVLFVAERFLPALTLAGAAEEIFGLLLVRRGGVPVI